MTAILLISPETALLDSLKVVLPASVSVTQVATPAEAIPHLTYDDHNPAPLTLILLHAENRSSLVAGCRALRRDYFVANIPLIVLLTCPEDREAALAAGADDYLLLPLLAAEVKARLGIHLRSSLNVFRIWYEMSHQFAAGLDLDATLSRTLYWVGRLFEVEVGALWMIDSSKEMLKPVAALGIELASEESSAVPIGRGLIGSVAEQGEPVIVNDPANDTRLKADEFATLQITPRNIIALPMIYHGQLIGVLSLFNKKAGFFDQTDLTLLSSAIEMIAIAIGNARLYTQTLTLLDEREHLHQQILQAERLSTVGRLTATLSHEINNPMQVIQGALMLALEELDSPQDLAKYLDLCLEESKRVVQLLNRMRQIYRPQADVREFLDLNHLLQEAISLVGKELKWHKVILQTDLDPDLPQVGGVANQLHLVFLSLLLNLSDAISTAGGGRFHLRSYAHSQAIRIEFTTDIPISPPTELMDPSTPIPSAKDVALNFGLSLSQDIIAAQGGSLVFNQHDGQTICRIELPISDS